MGLMQISRRVDYGLRAVVYLSSLKPDQCCSITEIAKRQGVPRKFLEKIFQDLLRKGLITSRRGACGGYALARAAEAINFYQVIEALKDRIDVVIKALLDFFGISTVMSTIKFSKGFWTRALDSLQRRPFRQEIGRHLLGQIARPVECLWKIELQITRHSVNQCSARINSLAPQFTQDA
jgi:Rrf2 family protein